MREKIQMAAENISKNKDRVDYKHIAFYCRKAYGFDVLDDYDYIRGALEEINCYPISRTKFDLTGINSIYDYLEIAQDKHSSVYFIGSLKEGVCKIGYSIEPEQRLSQIQTGCPYDVEILATIEGEGHQYEKYLHNKFNHLRLKGEWFRINEEIESLIKQNQAPILM